MQTVASGSGGAAKTDQYRRSRNLTGGQISMSTGGYFRMSLDMDYARKSQAFDCTTTRGAERVIEGRDCR
jgi:hypothetical protein